MWAIPGSMSPNACRSRSPKRVPMSKARRSRAEHSSTPPLFLARASSRYPCSTPSGSLEQPGRAPEPTACLRRLQPFVVLVGERERHVRGTRVFPSPNRPRTRAPTHRCSLRSRGPPGRLREPLEILGDHGRSAGRSTNPSYASGQAWSSIAWRARRSSLGSSWGTSRPYLATRAAGGPRRAAVVAVVTWVRPRYRDAIPLCGTEIPRGTVEPGMRGWVMASFVPADFDPRSAS